MHAPEKSPKSRSKSGSGDYYLGLEPAFAFAHKTNFPIVYTLARSVTEKTQFRKFILAIFLGLFVVKFGVN